MSLNSILIEKLSKLNDRPSSLFVSDEFIYKLRFASATTSRRTVTRLRSLYLAAISAQTTSTRLWGCVSLTHHLRHPHHKYITFAYGQLLNIIVITTSEWPGDRITVSVTITYQATYQAWLHLHQGVLEPDEAVGLSGLLVHEEAHPEFANVI